MTTESVEVVNQNPSHMLELAIEKGADPKFLEKMMDLNERWNAGQSRKAYVLAMTKFKAEVPPVLSKDASVDFGTTHYRYANLGSIVAVVTPLLCKQELSAAWETRQTEKDEIEVTCHLTHSAGHRESVTLRGMPDNSGNKNKIQMIGSTVEYLRRYTFLCATGLATGDVDTDGRAEGNAQAEPRGGFDTAKPVQPAAPSNAPAPVHGEGFITGKIEKVEYGKGTNKKTGKDWEKWAVIIAGDKRKFGTFDTNLRDEAEKAMQAGQVVRLLFEANGKFFNLNDIEAGPIDAPPAKLYESLSDIDIPALFDKWKGLTDTKKRELLKACGVELSLEDEPNWEAHVTPMDDSKLVGFANGIEMLVGNK